MALKRTFYGRSDVGRKRQINEDSFYYSETEALCVVADGMGGHSFGEIASKMAVENVKNYFIENIYSLRFTQEQSREEIFEKLTLEIQKATGLANSNIYGCIKIEGSGKRMGTTLVMLYFYQDYVFVAHVGDSRGYVLRKKNLQQITEDHTVINRWLKIGQISQEQAEEYKRSPNSKYVTRALGTKPDIKADIEIHRVQHDDIFLLCTDGLTDLLADEEIAKVMMDFPGELPKVAKTLISIANARGGKDNITVILAHLMDTEQDRKEKTEVFYRQKSDPSTETFVRQGDKIIPKKG